MATQPEIDDFLAHPPFAVAGVSRDRAKFGHKVFFDLKAKGYAVLALNPNTTAIGRNPVYPDLAALPELPGGVITVIPPAQTEALLREVARLGITRVWMQPGSQSAAAIEFCRAHGIQVVADECIMLYAPPVRFPYNVQRWVNRLKGRKLT